jgi:hypothetical protein
MTVVPAPHARQPNDVAAATGGTRHRHCRSNDIPSFGKLGKGKVVACLESLLLFLSPISTRPSAFPLVQVMADMQSHGPGGHYSGRNKIPTINEFISKLDGDKKERDRQIDEQRKAEARGDAVPHRPQESKLEAKEDPTTGKTVVIEDVNQEMVDASKNPVVSEAMGTRLRIEAHLTREQLSVPNANLNKPTVCRTANTRAMSMTNRL